MARDKRPDEVVGEKWGAGIPVPQGGVVELGFRQLEGETPEAAMVRIATRAGLLDEVLTHFRYAKCRGAHDAQAAWEALCEWDILEIQVHGVH